ncbi:hypothetical protein AQUCO_02300183v1 [Aquilegia coerulea]|uniref:Uncharacterized protein n=1 Tax=Aquilegia coerulea TaxID=218851 RepID=A0A2G5DCK0_AQUCA|nr:hypothetical protein AQUCO_02300183v1 [Aquilegia coerulea]
MAAARNMISKSTTRFLVSASSSILLRPTTQFLDLPSSSSRRLFCCMPSNDPTLLKSGDWAPRVVSGRSVTLDFLHKFDIGRWIVRFKPPNFPKKHYQDKELFDLYVKAITPVVGRPRLTQKP